MKKKVFIGLVLGLGVLGLASCKNSQEETKIKTDDGISFVEKTYDFKNYSSEFDYKTGKIDTYFKGKDKYLPYVDLEQFIKASSGIYDLNRVEFNDDKDNQRFILKVDGVDNIFDYKNQKIEYEALNFLVELQETDYSYCLKTEDFYDEDKDYKCTLDLAKYDIELFHASDKLLIDFNLLNLLLSSENLYLTTFNGNGYYGDFYFFSDELQNDAYTSNLKGTSIPDEVKKLDAKYLTLLMENYYGLYDYKHLENDEDTNNLINVFSNAKTHNYSQTVFDYFNSLDDGHTGMISYPFYSGGIISSAEYGKTVETLFEVDELLAIQKAQKQMESQQYEIVGNTMYISFDSFDTDSDFDLDNIDLNVEYTDSFIYIYTCLEKAKQANNIENVVFDISTNGGGNIGALFRIFGLLTNDDIIINEEVSNFGLDIETRVKVDTDFDDDYEDDDAYTMFNYYILTSEASFSCANFFPTVAKAQNLATIIGQKSSGGMCSVMTYVLPSGIQFQTSSSSRQYTTLNGNKYYLEGGAPVDIEIPYEKFYDFEYINTLINKK